MKDVLLTVNQKIDRAPYWLYYKIDHVHFIWFSFTELAIIPLYSSQIVLNISTVGNEHVINSLLQQAYPPADLLVSQFDSCHHLPTIKLIGLRQSLSEAKSSSLQLIHLQHIQLTCNLIFALNDTFTFYTKEFKTRNFKVMSVNIHNFYKL